MDQQTIFLGTGACRGQFLKPDDINVHQTTEKTQVAGKGLVSLLLLLLQRPNTLVIASLRDATSTAANNVPALPTAPKTHLITIQITQLDTVIAVSGIANAAGPAHTAHISPVWEHFRVNAIGTLILYQVVYPLLCSSPLKTPTFVAVSSHAGLIGDMENEPFPFTAYGSSKAALNFMVREMYFETEERSVVVFPVHPGWVATELGNRGAEMAGLESALVNVAQSARGIMERIDGVTRAETGRVLFPGRVDCAMLDLDKAALLDIS